MRSTSRDFILALPPHVEETIAFLITSVTWIFMFSLWRAVKSGYAKSPLKAIHGVHRVTSREKLPHVINPADWTCFFWFIVEMWRMSLDGNVKTLDSVVVCCDNQRKLLLEMIKMESLGNTLGDSTPRERSRLSKHGRANRGNCTERLFRSRKHLRNLFILNTNALLHTDSQWVIRKFTKCTWLTPLHILYFRIVRQYSSAHAADEVQHLASGC